MRFDGPFTDQVTNSGVIGGDITVTTSDPSGFPAKYRGIYFDGTNGSFIALPAFTFNHTCSLHFWIMTQIVGNRTIFWKDRNVFTGNDYRHLYIKFDKHGKIMFRIAEDDDVNNYANILSDTDYTINVWMYLVVSLELDNNQHDM